jgi:hypothetical protein
VFTLTASENVIVKSNLWVSSSTSMKEVRSSRPSRISPAMTSRAAAMASLRAAASSGSSALFVLDEVGPV